LPIHKLKTDHEVEVYVHSLLHRYCLRAVLASCAMIQSLLAGGEVRHDLQTKRTQHMLANITDHIVVCGYGHVGQSVARHVRREEGTLVLIARGLRANLPIASRAGRPESRQPLLTAQASGSGR